MTALQVNVLERELGDSGKIRGEHKPETSTEGKSGMFTLLLYNYSLEKHNYIREYIKINKILLNGVSLSPQNKASQNQVHYQR